jgi:tyrosine-protein kinase Etk/Wzc
MEIKQELSREAKGRRFLPIENFDSPGMGALDLLLILAANKKLIAGMAVAGTLIAGLIAFQRKDAFTATAVIVLPQQQKSTIASLVGQLSPAGAAIGGTDLLKTPADLYISLMSSRTVADGLIAQFDLQRIYKVKNLTSARRALANRTRFISGKDVLIRISVDDGSPRFAAEIANAYVEQLHKLNSKLALTESAQRRLFFEQRLKEEKEALSEAEAAMKTTQEHTGIVQVSSQMELLVRTIAQLRAEITVREVLLETLKAGATDKNPEVVRVQVELDSLRVHLRQLESGSGARPATPPTLGPANAPAFGLAYLRRLREFQYHELLFESLGKQYEAARLDEAKEAPMVQVVDQAIPPEEGNPKHRLWIVLFGAVSLGTFGGCLAIFRHLLTDPARAARIHAIKLALWSRRAREARLA